MRQCANAAGQHGGKPMSQTARAVSPTKLRHVMLTAAIGSALEWYDFFIYGTASALVFGELFFPKYDTTVATLAAFATFAVGFLARPFGGLFFGHFGDRMGRKPMLVATLLLVGGGTFLIGLLPTYATIGIWAPILLLLLRLLQGFGAGAEYGGAVIMAGGGTVNLSSIKYRKERWVECWRSIHRFRGHCHAGNL